VLKLIGHKTTKEINTKLETQMPDKSKRTIKRKDKLAFNHNTKKRRKTKTKKKIRSLTARSRERTRESQKLRQKADSNDFTRS